MRLGRLWVLLVIIAGIAAIVLTIRDLIPRDGNVPDGYREVKSYVDHEHAACLSVSDPACGNCPGKIINDKCYVPDGSYPQFF